MLFGLVTSKQINFFDPKTNDHYNDYTFDQTKFNKAKIIVAYPFQQNSIKQKIDQNLQIEFFNLSDALQARNQKLFNLNDKQQPKVQLEIDLDNQIVKSYFKTNEGVEIISNKEFERTFTPTQEIEDQFYHFLKKNVNQLPQFKDALNLTNIQAFLKDNQQILYSNISNNLICDLVISNLATSVIITFIQIFIIHLLIKALINNLQNQKNILQLFVLVKMFKTFHLKILLRIDNILNNFSVTFKLKQLANQVLYLITFDYVYIVNQY